MATIAEALMQAFGHHQAGRFPQAEQLYRAILRADPRHHDALHLIGMVAYSTGRGELAIEYMREALRSKPDFPEAHNNLGNILLEYGKIDEAIANYREAIQLKPEYVEAHNNLGNALKDLGRLEEAEAACRAAIQLQPDFAGAHNNLGNVLKELRKPGEAATCYREAIRLNPGYSVFHNNLGNILLELGQAAEAAACHREAIRLKPDYAEAFYNLGLVLREQGRTEEAISAYKEAVRLKPGYAEAHDNLGMALKDLGHLEEAAACYREAIQLKPNFAEAHLHVAMIYLRLGNFEQGWPEYEWRRHCKGFGAVEVGAAVPMWDGSPLKGRTIFLAAEQGLGDTIQFLRYASLVKERGGKVILGCQKVLVPLLQGCAGVDKLVASSADMTPIDLQVSLLSLPGIMGTTITNIPAAVPYLHADPELVEQWHAELSARPGFKVGIAWQGSPHFEMDRLRSVPLRHFLPLARAREAVFISLQKQHGLEQMAEVTGRLPLVDLGDRLDGVAGAFMDTAAIMKNLDLVITSDSAVAHLAGALGVPVWVALPFIGDWRYLTHREDSPWYPTMRLFRQREFGNWSEVFERIAGELEKKAR